MGTWNPQKAHEWYLRNRGHVLKQHSEYYERNKAEIANNHKQWHEKHPDYLPTYHLRTKLLAMQMISGQERPACVYCGCDDICFLEANHKNGGGSKEASVFIGKNGRRYRANPNFYWNIIKKRRKTDDLEVTCGLCNKLHYYKMKYGTDAVKPFQVEWFRERAH